jgi:hypothetical protein
MGKMLYIFCNLEKHILNLRDELFMLDGDLADAMEDAFYSQWRMIRTGLYYEGALTNSYLFHNKELVDDSKSLTVYKRVFQKLCPPETYLDVVQDFLAFRHKQGPFHNMLDPNDQNCLALIGGPLKVHAGS